MIQLFNGMQSSLSMVYDREMGSMRVLLVSPLPRWYLLICKLMAGVFVSLMQVYAFLAIAYAFEIDVPPVGYIAVAPALLLTGMMLGAIGLLLSSLIRQLENFAGVMNFVIFPMFFASSALYPLWRLKEANDTLYQIASINPFTHAVELIRFALYGAFDPGAAAAVLAFLALFLGAAIIAYDPARGLTGRLGGGPV
jgi:ABC-2 type transport system permease protein